MKQSQKKKAQVIYTDYQTNRIDVLDGIRAISIIIVVWFHFWQQTWLIPSIGNISLDWLSRNGSLLVDMLIFLSGFCLFLPHARSMVYSEPIHSTGTFYIKRAARIMPSYYFSVLIILLLFVLPLKEYSSVSFMWKDLLTHIFFVHNLFTDTMTFSKLNGVLWTVAVEMQFYLIFPLLAGWFRKRPWITYLGMTLTGLISSYFIRINFHNINQAFYVNHPLTFASVFANGMLCAWIYISYTKNKRRNRKTEFLYLFFAVVSIFIFKELCQQRTFYPNGQEWQVKYRYSLSLIYFLIVFSILMAQRYFRPLLGNRFMKFVAEISFNLYIWHQYIAVKLKEFRIPYWTGDIPPNQTGDKPWMWKYQMLCILISLIAAVATTYLIEKPAAKLIMKLYRKKATS